MEKCIILYNVLFPIVVIKQCLEQKLTLIKLSVLLVDVVMTGFGT